MKIESPSFLEQPSENRLLVFVHIPKTAGTTLESILAHRFLPDERYKITMRGITLIESRYRLLPKRLISPSKMRNFKATLRTRSDLREIHGHFDMSLGRFFPPRAELMSVLRDPVERALSHYYHYRRWTADAVHPLALNSTLVEWVTARGLVEMDNGQTRRLAGETRLPIGGVTAATLAKAKANLEKFKLVGLTERFDEFQILLHRHFGWSYTRYPARNVGGNRLLQTEVDSRDLHSVETFNRFDRQLYLFATELFEQAISGIDMDKELALFQQAPMFSEPAPTLPAAQAVERAPSSVLERFRSLFSA